MPKKPNLSNARRVEAADEPNIISSGMGAPPVSHGKKIEPVLPDDDLDTQRLTEQRLDDADDDLRTQARRVQKHNDR
jgi:hypothetical protein